MNEISPSVLEAYTARNFHPHVVTNGAEAITLLTSLIPAGSTVRLGLPICLNPVNILGKTCMTRFMLKLIQLNKLNSAVNPSSLMPTSEALTPLLNREKSLLLRIPVVNFPTSFSPPRLLSWL
jgi:hypothetical protein